MARASITTGSGQFVSFAWLPGKSPGQALAPNVERYGDRVLDVLDHELAAVAQQALAWAKSHHPWQNVTGAAEAGLTVATHGLGEGPAVRRGFSMFNTTYHGSGLEVWRGGKWGVIRQAMLQHYPAVRAAMDRAVS